MTLIRTLVAALSVVAAAPCATAATLQVVVTDDAGAPVSDAVVTLAPKVAPKAAARAPATHAVDQRNETFIPYVEVFRPGDLVRFANSDGTRHHVYSFSPARKFEFVLAPGEQAPPMALENPGVIAVGCNIHDHMVSYLYVSEAAFAARTEAGRASFRGLAPGEYAVRVWHPQLRRDRPEQVARVAEAAPGRVSFVLSLGPDPRRPRDRERSGY